MVRSILAIAAGFALAMASGCSDSHSNSAPPAATPVSAAPTAPAEVRGTWLTTTANDAISTPAKTAATMKRLCEIGLNTVYIECWKNGYTEFPSETMNKLIGIPMKINDAPPELQRDLLQENIIEAHRNGMLAIGWFEYGFMTSYKDTQNELRALGEKEGWLLRNKDGNLVSKQDSFVWMNPLHPKPREILLNIVLDAVRRYDLDGVQLDDRISMPTNMGYDDYTRALYAKEHNGAQPPDDGKDPAWIKWRADKISEFAKVFAAEVRKANPKIIVSVSPAPYPWCYENFACDWPTWTTWTGSQRWDEYIPQNYRFNYERTKASIDEGLEVIGDRRPDLYTGIRLVGDGPDMPVPDLLKSIEYSRQIKLGGHVHWFSRGVLDIFAKDLQDFYNVAQLGQAPHPARPRNWRMPSVVAKESKAGEWTGTIVTPARYHIIAKANGNWQVIGSLASKGGAFKIARTGAEAVELLVDRRP